MEFKLPDLGEGIHEAEILKWLVAPGQVVKEDDPLVEVETDKAAVALPSPFAGRVVSVHGGVGDVVQVGQVLVVVEAAGGLAQIEPAPKPQAPAAKPPSPAAKPPSPAAKPPIAAARGPVPAAPATRRLARELGVDLALVAGSGPAGRVTPEDVKRSAPPLAAPQQQPQTQAQAPAVAGGTTAASPPPESRARAEAAARASSSIPFFDLEPLPDFSAFGETAREPLVSIRRRVAHRMVTSMTLIPHVAHMDEADVTLLEEFRLGERRKREGKPGGHLTLLSFVVKAVTAGLRAAPIFNASLDPFSEEIVYKRYYNIGFAADTGRGLVVPVLAGTDRKSILEISAEIERLAAAAREGALEVKDLRGGTFTITNIGPLGGTALIPAINYPEAAILGMGKVQEKPVVRDGQIVVRKMLPLTLAFDHRLADGADAARFVSEMVNKLSDPGLLLVGT
jgi:pyruvate dehydrogenase E2 component (dihydrolipoamide acetyltransferase)